MTKTLASLAVLTALAVPRAALAAPLHVFADDGDRPFQVEALDATHEVARCALPPPTGCHLQLRPGPVQVDFQTGDQRQTRRLDLPPQGLDLRLTYRSLGMAWWGLGIASNALLWTGFALNEASGGINSSNAANVGIDIGIAGANLLVGVILMVIGFQRAGPESEVRPLSVTYPSEPPPASLDVPPPPLPNVGPGWTTGAPTP